MCNHCARYRSFPTITALVSVLLIAMFGSLNSPSASAQSQQWDSSWVPADTFFFGALNVQNLLNYEEEDSALRKYLVEQMQKQVHVQLSDLLQAQMIMSGELEDDQSFEHDGEELLVLKLMFGKAQDFAEFRKNAGGEFTEETIEGKTVFVPESEYQPALCFPNDRTILIGMKPGLTHVLENESSMSGLIDRIQAADFAETDVYATFERNEVTEQFLELIAEETNGLPFDLADIGSEAVKGEAVARFSDGKPLRANITAENAEGAERLQRATDALISMGKLLLPAAKESLEEDDDTDFGDGRFKEFMKEQKRINREFLDIAEAVLEGAQTSTSENELKMQVTAMGGIGKAVNLLGQQLQSGMKMSEQFDAVADAVIEDAVEAAEDAAEKITE